MLVMNEVAANHPELGGAYFDGSLELLRELAVRTDLDAALPRLSAIASKMLPHDAVSVACFDQRGHLVVNASTSDLPEMTASERGDLIIDDLRSGGSGASNPLTAERLVGLGYRSGLSVSIGESAPEVRVAFWSKQPLAFNPTHLPLARRIAYHLGLAACRSRPATVAHIDDARAPRVDIRVQRGIDRLKTASRLHVVGGSAEWRGVLGKATQVAAVETTVLITGASGTGKEVVARFIHAASARNAGPFVALNCAALPEQLLESELFGYERGAFTSAQQSKPGQLELAAGGVLFLDEVGEMSLAAQAKFLRVLQEREFQRLGGTRVQKANIRVDRRDQPRSATGRRARRVPRRPVLPPQRLRHSDSAAARTARRHRVR